MKAELPGLLEEIKTLSADLQELIESNKEGISDNMERARELIEKLSNATTTLEEILDKINKGEGSIGKLLNDPNPVDQANELMGEMKTVLTDLKSFMEAPTRLTFDYGFRTEFYEKSEDFKYYYRLAMHFNETDSAYFELINDQIYNKPPIYDPGISVGQTDQPLEFLGDDFTLSATYGRKFSRGVVRLGLIESSTGVGIDLDTGFDPISFTFEGYDFGRDKGPHFKLSTNLRLWKGLHLTIGYDDPADEDKAQVFWGGGYRF
jgi:phospholipid/cholesterol/gamma-HCH transport system substrate-binding protein